MKTIELKTKRIGNSIGIIFPKEIVEQYSIKEGQIIKIDIIEISGKNCIRIVV